MRFEASIDAGFCEIEMEREMSLSVSAIITTYKRDEETLRRAIESVAAQTLPVAEILVIDDNREDEVGIRYSVGVQKAAKGFENVRVIPTEGGKHGAQAARNTGIHASKGELLAFLDDDDEWLPRKMECQVALMEANPEAGLCYCRGVKINLNFDPPVETDYHGSDFKPTALYKDMLRNDSIGTTTQAMIRKSVLAVAGEFDEALPARQDYEMWLRLTRCSKAIGAPEQLFKYYIGKNVGQISKNWDGCIEGHMKLYNKYKEDIDKDRAAVFNVQFNLAHYYMKKSGAVASIPYYTKAFFKSPVLFWKKGIIKLQSWKHNRSR